MYFTRISTCFLLSILLTGSAMADARVEFLNPDGQDADCFVNDIFQGVAPKDRTLVVHGLPAGQTKIHAVSRVGSGSWGPRFVELRDGATETLTLDAPRLNQVTPLDAGPLTASSNSSKSSSGGLLGCHTSQRAPSGEIPEEILFLLLPWLAVIGRIFTQGRGEDRCRERTHG